MIDFARIRFILNNDSLGRFLLVLVTLLIVLIIPILVSLAFPLFKNKLTDKSKVYLYAFSTGFFATLGLFGFMRESLEVSSIFAASIYGANDLTSIYLSNIGIVAGGALIGLTFAFVIKFWISHNISKKLLKNSKLGVFIHQHDHGTEKEHTHEHPTFIFNRDDKLMAAESALAKKTESKLKIIALLLLLTHRIPEGFIMGYNLNLLFESKSGSLTIAFFISFIIHLIPEEMVFYYRLRDAGYGKWQALFMAIGFLFLFFPFMLIGVYFGSEIQAQWWLRGMLYSAVGGIFIFTALIEFFPEFYHTNFDKKRWYKVVLFLLLGIIFSVFVLSFHTHGIN